MIDRELFARMGCADYWRDSYEGLTPSELLQVLPMTRKLDQLRRVLIQRTKNTSKRRDNAQIDKSGT